MLRSLKYVFLVCAVLLNACSMSKDTKAAELAVARVSCKQMASASLADIYAPAAPGWKCSMSRSDAVAFLGAVNRSLGTVKSSVQTGWRDNVTTGGHIVILQYHTEFEGGGADGNRFAIRLDGGKFGQLAGYHINSLAMMVK